MSCFDTRFLRSLDLDLDAARSASRVCGELSGILEHCTSLQFLELDCQLATEVRAFTKDDAKLILFPCSQYLNPVEFMTRLPTTVILPRLRFLSFGNIPHPRDFWASDRAMVDAEQFGTVVGTRLPALFARYTALQELRLTARGEPLLWKRSTLESDLCVIRASPESLTPFPARIADTAALVDG